jgi:hypothetical protein
MSRRHSVAVAAAALLLLGVPRLAPAAPQSFNGREDVGALLTEAQKTWPPAAQDALILVESARFTWLADGRLREERYRLVWINSSVAVRSYADLRVPWDSSRQTLTVKALRVWRDGRWIEHRPTAVVETTPFAFRDAPDYTGVRETMLLHDGVEVPCVLECDYVIEDKVAYRAGFEGRWIFAQGDPALESRIVVEAPEGVGLRVAAPAEAERFEAAVTAGGAVQAYRMRKVAAAPSPATADPASYLPHATWSTFASREALGAPILKGFQDGLTLDTALRDSLSTLRATALGRTDLARRIAGFVKRSQRRVAYDPQLLWARARPASRTYDTGYGADFDLAILAGALFEEAGFEGVTPVFLHRGFTAPAERPPTLAEYDLRGVLVRDGEARMLYDVAHGTLETGAWHKGSQPWTPGVDLPAARPAASRSETAIELRWDRDAVRWTVEGTAEATGMLNPIGVRDLAALDTRTQVERFAGAVVESLTVSGFSLADLGPDRASVRFEGAARPHKRDATGRLPLVIGDPAGGLMASLPADVHLYQTERGTPVQLPGTLEQTVMVHLRVGSLEMVRLPEAVEVTDAAGSFRLSVEHKDDEVTISRTIRLAKASYAPEEWPALRALLLAEGNAGNRTVLLR